jgi:hypothetical protein
MMETRWTSVIPVLEEFQACLSPDLPKFGLTAANDRQWSEDQYQAQCAGGVFRQRGVYIIFDGDAVLQYIGIAMYRFDDRIWSHDDWIQRRWTDVISLPNHCYFLAPALEFFLIVRLQPPGNTQYKDYRIPERIIEPSSGGDSAKAADGLH